MLLYDIMDDGQSQAAAGYLLRLRFLPTEETFEDVRQFLLGDAYAGVRYRHRGPQPPLSFCRAGENVHFSPFRGVVKGISHQVVQRLRQLIRVRQRQRVWGRRLVAQRHPATLG